MTHILDSPESNMPELAKSQAAEYTDRIKLICPLMFPVANSHDRINKNRAQNDENFNKVRKCMCCGGLEEDVKRAENGLTYDLFPTKTQKLKNDFKSQDEEEVNTPWLQSTLSKANDIVFAMKVENAVNEKAKNDPDFAEFVKQNGKLFTQGGDNIDYFDDEAQHKEPQIFFMGTASMKPGKFRGASAIYLLNRGHGVLMDCAEGSYG